jgi:Tfp pilus assembly protein PilO
MKLSQEKRNQSILTLVCIVGVLALMWSYLIHPRYVALSKIAATENDAANKLENIKKSIKNADAVTSELANVAQTLSRAEDDTVSGDPYSWTYDTIRVFKTSHRVDIPKVGHPDVGDVNLLPDFPFKQVKFSINGTAYYHDLGKFIADFENAFPHIRVVNLEIQPAPAPDGNDEKLSFKMDIIALVKPASL